MRKLEARRMIPKSGSRFPAFAKPASAGEGRSDKVMPKRERGGGVNAGDARFYGLSSLEGAIVAPA